MQLTQQQPEEEMKATLGEGGRGLIPLKGKTSKKMRGTETRAREVKGPSPSVANHVIDLIFKPIDP